MPSEIKIKQKYRVPPKIIFEALTNEELMQRFTQTKAKFDPNGEFFLYDGRIIGTNVKFEENSIIQQKWQFDSWPQPADLTITFKEISGGETLISLIYKNIPDRDNYGNRIEPKELESGWRSQIFQKISTFLGYPMNNDQESSDEEDY